MTERELRDGMGVVGDCRCDDCVAQRALASFGHHEDDPDARLWTLKDGELVPLEKGGQAATDEEVAEKGANLRWFVVRLVVVAAIVWALVEWLK